PSSRVLQDDAVGYRMYALKSPLLPGDSLRLDFAIQFKSRGFKNSGVDPSVAPTATYFEGNDWLPTVGYETALELDGPGERREHGLPPHRPIRALEDVAARQDVRGNEHVSFEATIGTDAGQIAVAPGALRRSWSDGGRRYFDYATDV